MSETLKIGTRVRITHKPEHDQEYPDGETRIARAAIEERATPSLVERVLLAMGGDNGTTYEATLEQASALDAALGRMQRAGCEWTGDAIDAFVAEERDLAHARFSGFDGFAEADAILDAIFDPPTETPSAPEAGQAAMEDEIRRLGADLSVLRAAIDATVGEQPNDGARIVALSTTWPTATEAPQGAVTPDAAVAVLDALAGIEPPLRPWSAGGREDANREPNAAIPTATTDIVSRLIDKGK